MRRLTLHALLSLGVALAPFAMAAQAPADSMYALPWVREALGPWRGDSVRVWCVTRHADFGSLFVIASVARPDSAAACQDPAGGYYPIIIDLPECPQGDVVPVHAAFALVRCSEHEWRRFPLPRAGGRRT